VKQVIIDGFAKCDYWGKIRIETMRFRDRDLGERLRQATLEGFGIE